ncbi:sarcosine oxidase [Jannaschia pagri]|uniref:Sarcosine oxidase n=1 Tax=Jannaschia pagri TaxID=2829797 RepID=A0ABQ4NI87_9RHOB|nr:MULTISPECIES: FAD-dependent oxidoreductase [unclassified Jannaschia]GIT89773.1 sarcosine oxidase [Jannaschia sp. AI_61]GIT94119.1 sarcosine oxidase [Jannaschia sp. AI_62]
MESFDVIVIGGGMMGAPCARYLAEAGHRVAVVAAPEPSDPQEWAGPFGSHFDAARITRQGAGTADWSHLSQRSIARYADLEARSGRRIFQQSGALMAGPTSGPMAAQTSAVLSVARGLSPAPEVLTSEEVLARFGMALPEGGKATWEAEAAGWIDPRAMWAAQVSLAEQAGARVVRDTACAFDGGSVRLKDGTRMSAGHLIVATGPHAASDGLLPRRPKLTVWGRTIAFAQVSEAEAARLANVPSLIWVPEGWTYGLYMLPPIRYPDGNIYIKIGGEVESPKIRSDAEMTAWYRGGGDRDVGQRLLAEMRQVLPGLRIEGESTGACAVVWTETGYPYIAPASDNVTVLCGGNGAAAKCGDELGRLGARVAQGHDLSGEGYDQDFAAVWA